MNLRCPIVTNGAFATRSSQIALMTCYFHPTSLSLQILDHISKITPISGLLSYKGCLSTKLEVHNILHHQQRMVKPLLQATYTENLVMFGHVIFEICEQVYIETDRETDIHTDCNTLHPYGGGQINNRF